MKRAFITGIAGQDGSYLAELLLEKNYEVHGLIRRDQAQLEHLIRNPEIFGKRLYLHFGELEDASSLRTFLEQSAPDEIYHLAAQTHVGRSFDSIEETCRVTGFGTLHLLEAVRKLPKPARFFQASSCEIFGSPQATPQNEFTPVAPITPYGCAKAFATQLVRMYRQTLGLFAVNGILFNHESPRRGEHFVTQKICRAAAAIKFGKQRELVLGDTGAQRDWGHARDFVRGIWLALQHDAPEDFVFATGRVHRVQDIIEIAFGAAGLDWQKYVRTDPQFFRAADPRQVVGDPARAKKLLGWQPEISFEATIAEMVCAEIKNVGASQNAPVNPVSTSV